MPFSPVPRIHLSHRHPPLGARRGLASRTVDAVTVYLLAEGPWLAGVARIGAVRHRPAQGPADRRERERRLGDWRPGGHPVPAGVAREFPTAEGLAQDAESWLDGNDGVIAAVTHHPTMGYHGVGTGLMPSERQRLTEWAAQALEPQFRPVADLTPEQARKATPKALLNPGTCRAERRTATPEKVARSSRAGPDADDRRRQRAAAP